jgi:hypothetical protein
VAVAVVLAAVAMLLAAPAYAEEGSLLLERHAGLAPPESALLTLRYGAAVVERTALIAPGETLRVELEYRARAPQERRLLTRCC